MQTVVQVVCTAGRSLRVSIANDGRLSDYDLVVSAERKLGRSPGWTKLHGTSGQKGSINIEWDAAISMLICRVVNRGSGSPGLILSGLVRYLLERHAKRVKLINIIAGSPS
jgi:hypothetical protein